MNKLNVISPVNAFVPEIAWQIAQLAGSCGFGLGRTFRLSETLSFAGSLFEYTASIASEHGTLTIAHAMRMTMLQCQVHRMKQPATLKGNQSEHEQIG